MFAVLNLIRAIWYILYCFKIFQKILALSEDTGFCNLSALLFLIAWSNFFRMVCVSVAFPNFSHLVLNCVLLWAAQLWSREAL